MICSICGKEASSPYCQYCGAAVADIYSTLPQYTPSYPQYSGIPGDFPPVPTTPSTNHAPTHSYPQPTPPTPTYAQAQAPYTAYSIPPQNYAAPPAITPPQMQQIPYPTYNPYMPGLDGKVPIDGALMVVYIAKILALVVWGLSMLGLFLLLFAGPISLAASDLPFLYVGVGILFIWPIVGIVLNSISISLMTKGKRSAVYITYIQAALSIVHGIIFIASGTLWFLGILLLSGSIGLIVYMANSVRVKNTLIF